ncbi:MAG: M15 family metallopeptidase [Ferruginibacter sp.]|nr:M15 family metallopeptidase [Ferruginibacter sp.]
MNKITNTSYIKSAAVLFFLLSAFTNYAQDSSANRYGLLVIASDSAYHATVKKDSNKKMVDLKKSLPGLVFELRYAGKNNFTGFLLYPVLNTTYLRKPVAMALSIVQKDLKKQGLGLKIFDAYRPYAVTEKMWELVKNEWYAANPKTGSGHNRGISVDLTIINLQTKQPLKMGTDFDNFTDTAHHNFTALSKEILQNRLLLRTHMEKNGFKALETEWWHYSFITEDVYELLDIIFDDLAKRKTK